MNHSERGHAKYSASGYPRYSRCPGSPRLLSTLTARPSSIYAEDGTRAHELLELCLQERIRDCSFLEGVVISAAGTPIDSEHVRGVNVALDYIYSLLDDEPEAALMTEQHVFVPQTVVPQDQCGGTADVAIYIKNQKLLIVPDYKHGAGVPVEAIGNEQTRMYALGLHELLTLAGFTIDLIQITIIQPRCFHPNGTIRTDIVYPEDLDKFYQDNNAAIERCEDPKAPLIPGEIQCRWCDAQLVCPAREAMALSMLGVQSVDQLSSTVLPAPALIPPDRLAYLLGASEFISGWFAEIKKEALRLAREGVYIPGFKLVNAQARRRFNGEPQEIAEKFCLLFDTELDDIYPRQLLGIGDAEDLAKRKAKETAPRGQKLKAGERAKEAMAFLTLKESSGNTVLVPEADKRPAVNLAATAFAGVSLPQIEGPKT